MGHISLSVLLVIGLFLSPSKHVACTIKLWFWRENVKKNNQKTTTTTTQNPVFL